MVSSLTLADAQDELNKLIACGEVQYNKGVIGCVTKIFCNIPKR